MQSYKTKKKNIALMLSMFALTMLIMSYAAVPLYKMFCQVTGFGGTPKFTEKNDKSIISEKINIRFDSTIEKNSTIYFEPEQTKVNVKIGENSLAFYKAVNKSDKSVTTMSVFNVTPLQAGKYFNKIECFCFDEQVLDANQEVSMPVSFFIDPSIKDDKFIGNLNEITLSYTMYVR